MPDRPRLSRETIDSVASRDQSAVEFPPAATLHLPEKVVQFGTGAFLRGFADYFIDEANRRGEFHGSVVAISSTGTSRNAVLNEQDGLFTLAIQGMETGVARQHYRVVGSLSRALSARDEWDAVLSVARDPNIEIVISNTTEVGIVIDERDAFDARPPHSFPAKLTRFLAERATTFDYDVRRGLVVLPCELIDDNGTVLRAAVESLARRWALGLKFDAWLNDGVMFCNTLVDRIVPGVVAPTEATRLAHVFGYRDGLLTACETYALFAIEGDDALRVRLGFAGTDARIVVQPDVRPYRERKVRVLNGAHTIVAPAALLAGIETVREACEDERVGRFLRRVMLDEIVPYLHAPGAEEFAREVIERFANPFVRHALIDITLHATAKMRVRVVPSIIAYVQRTNRAPAWLAFGFAAYLSFMRGEIQTERRTAGLPVPEDLEGERVRLAWSTADLRSDRSIADFAHAICADSALWGADLGAGGFADAVSEHLVRILRHGVTAALDLLLIEPATI